MLIAPHFVAVGHTTSRSSRIQAVFPAGLAASKLVVETADGIVWEETRVVDAATPFMRSLRTPSWPTPASRFRYAFAAAPSPADFPTNGDFLKGPFGHSVAVPPTTTPLRLALVSCNDIRNKEYPPPRRGLLWRDLATRVAGGLVDLVVHAGDQIYGDDMPEKWTTDEGWLGFYRRHYVDTWGHPDVASVLASVPNVFMWDDHEIRDGYGSRDDDRSPAMIDRFGAALRIFREMQNDLNPDRFDVSSHAWSTTLGNTAIVALDGRQNRSWTAKAVLGSVQLDAFRVELGRLAASGVKTLYVVVGVPPLYVPSLAIDAILAALNLVGPAEPIDDIRDSWVAANNRAECESMLALLEGFASNGRTATLLAGDVHVASFGTIKSTRNASNGNVVHQVTSSGIARPPPSGLLGRAFSLVTNIETPVGHADFRGVLKNIGSSPLVMRRNYALVTERTGAAGPSVVLVTDDDGRVAEVPAN